MKIGIVGNGVVGHATARCFMEHHEVRVYDVVPERRTHTMEEATIGCDLTFVCIPEKSVDDFFANMAAEMLECKFVLRSTVPVGTTRRLAKEHCLKDIVHSPEFLTARCAVTDAQLPARNIIGFVRRPPDTETIHHPDGGTTVLNYPVHIAGRMLTRLYANRFPGVPICPMSSDESEAVKLMCNSLFAVKVALFNEFHAFAASAGLNWDAVLAAVLADGRIAHSHTKVPGPDGKYGFGGACLPKDLQQMIDCIESAVGDGHAPVCRAAQMRNELTDRRRT